MSTQPVVSFDLLSIPDMSSEAAQALPPIEEQKPITPFEELQDISDIWGTLSLSDIQRLLADRLPSLEWLDTVTRLEKSSRNRTNVGRYLDQLRTEHEAPHNSRLARVKLLLSKPEAQRIVACCFVRADATAAPFAVPASVRTDLAANEVACLTYLRDTLPESGVCGYDLAPRFQLLLARSLVSAPQAFRDFATCWKNSRDLAYPMTCLPEADRSTQKLTVDRRGLFQQLYPVLRNSPHPVELATQISTAATSKEQRTLISNWQAFIGPEWLIAERELVASVLAEQYGS